MILLLFVAVMEHSHKAHISFHSSVYEPKMIRLTKLEKLRQCMHSMHWVVTS